MLKLLAVTTLSFATSSQLGLSALKFELTNLAPRIAAKAHSMLAGPFAGTLGEQLTRVAQAGNGRSIDICFMKSRTT